jgi:hypothetical protein
MFIYDDSQREDRGNLRTSDSHYGTSMGIYLMLLGLPGSLSLEYIIVR